jgi:hypothetical protein
LHSNPILPKTMTNEELTKKILEHLFGILDRKRIFSVILYGNRKGRDIDLFIIAVSEKHYERIANGKLDLTIIEKGQLHHLISCLNPLVTEPVLTGQVIWGDPLLYEKEMLNKTKASILVENHLLESSFRILKEAEASLAKNNVKDALVNLSFSISFFYYSLYYAKHDEVITFRKLLTEYPNSVLSESYLALKGGHLGLNDVNCMVEKTKELLTR